MRIPAQPVLDALDRRLLAELDREPTVSFAALAERLDVSPRTVARRYAVLHHRGIVRVVGRTAAGFGGQEAWLGRAQAAPAVVDELATTLAAHAGTRWVRASRGGTELVYGLVLPTVTDPLLRLVPDDPRVRSVVLHDLLHVWAAASTAVTHPDRVLDELDRRLMAELATDGRVETSALASRLGVDASTVSRRRRRLVDEGIVHFEADIHPGALSSAGDAMVWLSVEPGSIRAVGQWLREQSECRFVAACSGPAAVVAHLVVPGTGGMLGFVDERLAGRGVSAVEVVPMGRVYKRNALGRGPRG